MTDTANWVQKLHSYSCVISFASFLRLGHFKQFLDPFQMIYFCQQSHHVRFARWKCCRKGDPFQGPKLGSCLTLGNELSKETHLLTKQEILLGKGTWVESREPRRTALPAWLAVSGFMVMGLVSGWSLANHSNSESFLVAHASLSQDGC